MPIKYEMEQLSSVQKCFIFYKRLFDLSSNQNQKPFEKKFETLAARADFVSLFFLQKQLIMTFWQEIITLSRPVHRGYEICLTNFTST